MTKGLAHLIAAQSQALGFLALAWFGGNWLNGEYPQEWSWLLVTFPIALLLSAHIFWVVIRNLNRQPPNGQLSGIQERDKKNKY